MGLQVEELTKGLQPWDKEFIDFSFDGKHISEFGLVAITDGDRLTSNASPSFSSETSTVNGLNGQYYWGTTFETGELSFKLATDGMTEKQISAFKQHFIPGRYGKLILDERLGRYCYARLATVSTLNFIPFQQAITINGVSFQTNIYKGEITLTLVMDYPYWISESHYIEGELTQETVRKAYVNNIPMSTTEKAVYIGDDTYYLTKDGPAALTSYDAALDTAKGQMLLYNPSEVKSPIKLTLSNQPISVTSSAPYYFNSMSDEYNGAENDTYIISDQSNNTLQTMQYTSPALFYYANKVISLAYSYKDNSGANLIDFQEKLQEEIRHATVLSWAAAGLQFITNHSELYDSSTGKFNSSSVTVYNYKGTSISAKWYEYLNQWMLFLCAPSNTTGTNIDIAQSSNSVWERNGSLGTYSLEINGIDTTSMLTYDRHTIGTTLGTEKNYSEKTGEMLLSGYLKVEGGSSLDENLCVQSNSCYILSHKRGNTTIELDKKNMTVEYRYLYL